MNAQKTRGEYELMNAQSIDEYEPMDFGGVRLTIFGIFSFLASSAFGNVGLGY